MKNKSWRKKNFMTYSNSEAFTLMELLVVIVILAIISVIATPIIIGIIEDSRTEAKLSSAYSIVDAARLYKIKEYEENRTLSDDINILSLLELNGEKPSSGEVKVNASGEVGLAVIYDNKCYRKEYTISTISILDNYESCLIEQ